MKKIKFTADTLLEIVKNIFQDEEVNVKVEDDDEDNEWSGKTINEILGVKYYTFKHRAISTKQRIEELQKKDPNLQANVLSVLDRSFCFVELDPIKRLFSKDIDELEVSGTLQYWLQTDKIKLLEELVENSNLATCGCRIPVIINNISRNIVIYFENPSVSSIDESEIGESCIATVNVTIVISPDVTNISDWQIQFLIGEEYVDLPVKNISFSNTMVGKSVPRANKSACSDQVNLSNTTSMTLVFDGYKDNEVVKTLASDTLSRGSNNAACASVNKIYSIKVIRNTEEYLFSMKVLQHTITPALGIENESHSLTLTTGRVDYGN